MKAHNPDISVNENPLRNEVIYTLPVFVEGIRVFIVCQIYYYCQIELVVEAG